MQTPPSRSFLSDTLDAAKHLLWLEIQKREPSFPFDDSEALDYFVLEHITNLWPELSMLVAVIEMLHEDLEDFDRLSRNFERSRPTTTVGIGRPYITSEDQEPV